MSDFLFSNSPGNADRFAWILSRLTRTDARAVEKWDGPWGSLAVPVNHYRGYQAYEDERAISVVVGGPLLRVRAPQDSAVPAGSSNTAAVLRQVHENPSGDWHRDLLGPFCFLHVDKWGGKFAIVTDNLSFIPAYKAIPDEPRGAVPIYSTHPDAAALAACHDGQLRFDPASVCDFILHKKVTFPHTLYKNVTELAPATVHVFTQRGHQESPYWRPSDRGQGGFKLETAAEQAADALKEILELAAEKYGRLSFLLSAGEDSRTLACMAPKDLDMHCITIAPGANREARIARRVAKSIEASWEFVEQPPHRYLQNLGRRSLFSGSNGLSIHAHMLGVINESSLAERPVVIGGFSADALLKGHFYKTRNALGVLDYHRYVENRENIDVERGVPLDPALLEEVASRRRAHEARLQQFRSTSVNEWMTCWPMSQDHEIVNVWSNRRLFASLEAFMCPKILDIAASLPADCVVNRRLFQKMAAPYLRKVRWIPHGEGHFPAFPWYANLLMRPVVRATRRCLKHGQREASPYAWPSPESWVASPLYARVVRRHARPIDQPDPITGPAIQIAQSPAAEPMQRLAAAQVLAAVAELRSIAQDASPRLVGRVLQVEAAGAESIKK